MYRVLKSGVSRSFLLFYNVAALLVFQATVFANVPEECFQPESSHDNKEVIQYAQCLKKNQRVLYAIDYLEDVADVAPAENVYALLSELNFYSGSATEALEAAKQSRKINPDYAPGKFWMANSMFKRAMQVSPAQLNGLQANAAEGCRPSEYELSQQDAALEHEYYTTARELFLEIADEYQDNVKAWASARHMAASSLIGLGDMDGGLQELQSVTDDLIAQYEATNMPVFANFAASVYASMANQASASGQPDRAKRFAKLAREYAIGDNAAAEVNYLNVHLHDSSIERNLPCHPIITQD